MTTQAEEVAFTRGMEHEPEPAHEATIKVGRDLWTIDGMSHRALGMTHRVLEALGVVQSRALSMAERGPNDFEESDFERGMKAGQRYGGGYNEAPKGDGRLTGVVIGCTVALLSAFFIGAWKLSTDNAAFRAEFNEWKQATAKWMDKTDDRMRQLENQRR